MIHFGFLRDLNADAVFRIYGGIACRVWGLMAKDKGCELRLRISKGRETKQVIALNRNGRVAMTRTLIFATMP